MAGEPQKTTRSPSTVALLALIGGLVGAAQYLTMPVMSTYHGGLPLELIGSIGGGAIVGALVGWIVQRVRAGKNNRRS